MDDLQKVVEQTPIEIALGIDENGHAMARKLYEFLELSPAHYAKWCKHNIVDNEFAEENVDFWAFTLNGEWGGQATTDYRLTAHFAKKLSMRGNGRKAEMAREYFTIIEERTKQSLIDRSQLSPASRMLCMLADSIAQQELEQKKQADQIARLEQTQEAIKEAVAPVTDNWRNEVNKKFNRIQRHTGADFKNLRVEMYDALDKRAGVDIRTRPRNLKSRMLTEGCTKTAVNNANIMDIIERDPKLREIFGKIVSEYEIKYCT